MWAAIWAHRAWKGRDQNPVEIAREEVGAWARLMAEGPGGRGLVGDVIISVLPWKKLRPREVKVKRLAQGHTGIERRRASRSEQYLYSQKSVNCEYLFNKSLFCFYMES